MYNKVGLLDFIQKIINLNNLCYYFEIFELSCLDKENLSQ